MSSFFICNLELIDGNVFCFLSAVSSDNTDVDKDNDLFEFGFVVGLYCFRSNISDEGVCFWRCGTGDGVFNIPLLNEHCIGT